MAQYSSYWLYQKYEKRGDQGWVPSYPNVYSIDGEGTMPLVMRIERDEACGYICDEQERWVEIPISQDYVCDDCEVGYLYRYVHCNPSAFTYYGDYKYEVLCEEISQDNGQTWSATTNTKLSSEPIGVAEKKVKITFDNGDVYAESCGSDDGVYSPSASNDPAIYYSQDAITHTTNLKDNSSGRFMVETHSYCINGRDIVYYVNGQQIQKGWECTDYALTTLNNVHKVEFGDCVTNISLQANNGLHERWYEGSAGNPIIGDGWGIEEVVFPSGLTSIEAGCFAVNNIRTLNFPSSLERIGDVSSLSATFARNRRLNQINFNEGLKTIGNYVFMNCSALDKVVLPSTLETLGGNVFSACTNLKQIIFSGSTPPEGQYGLSLSANDDTYVYVPCGSKSAYTEAIVDLPDERILEYGGACGNIPDISSAYNLVAYYTSGNTVMDSYYRGYGVSQNYTFSANSDFFDDITLASDYNDTCVFNVNNNVELYNGTYIPRVKRIAFNNAEGGYGKPYGINTSAEEITFGTNATFWGSFYESPNVKSVIINSGNDGYTTFRGGFSGCSELSSVTINAYCELLFAVFSYCPNLTDVYINYSGGVIYTAADPNHSDRVPFLGSNPTIHVPSSLYNTYKSYSFWSKFNIVINT